MNSLLLTGVKTAIKLVSYPLAIVGWCVSAASGAQANAPAEIVSDLFDADNITPSQLAAPAQRRANKSSRTRTKQQTRIETPAANTPKIAQQVPNLLPSSLRIAPLSLPFPVQPLQSSIPLNSLLTTDLILAPNNTPAVSSPNAPMAPTVRDPQYIITPRELAPTSVDPFSTQFILNGDKISHYTPTIVKAGYESGNFRNQDFNFSAYRVISANNIQSVTNDVVLRVNSNIEAVGIRSVESENDITVAIAKQQTLLGARQQISLDGDCQDNSGRICTYLPGITIDDSVIDPRKLQPTGVKITSQFDDVISPASVAAIREPGFQGGAKGENFGIDIYVPAIGLVDTPWSANPALTGSRQEKIKSNVAVNYTRMSQNLATNGVESGLGRTIRSINYIHNDRNQLLNAGVLALGQILPGFQPSVAAGKPGTKIVVNPNLYRAANAVRIPERAQTVYQSGTGYAPSRGENPRIPPGAIYQALWVGLSPVVEREFINDYYYVTRSQPQIVTSSGGEGGSLPVDVNLNNVGFNTGGVQNAYGQGYVTVYNRNVDRYDVQILRQRTDYYPHISWTGTNLTENTMWRYYTGAIANINLGDRAKATQDIKAYLGTDFSSVNPRGLSYSLSGIGYLNPDPEHASQVSANLQQSIGLGSNPQHNLALGLNVNYIIDGAAKIQSLPVRSLQSSVSLGAGVNLGNISLGGTQFIGNLLPESTDTKTIFNVGWKVTDRLNVGLLYTAADRNISTNPYGANLSYELDPASNSTLYLGWNASQIDFRRTLGANSNIYHDNTFTVSVRYGF
jgi:hypothetical protein